MTDVDPVVVEPDPKDPPPKDPPPDEFPKGQPTREMPLVDPEIRATRVREYADVDVVVEPLPTSETFAVTCLTLDDAAVVAQEEAANRYGLPADEVGVRVVDATPCFAEAGGSRTRAWLVLCEASLYGTFEHDKWAAHDPVECNQWNGYWGACPDWPHEVAADVEGI